MKSKLNPIISFGALICLLLILCACTGEREEPSEAPSFTLSSESEAVSIPEPARQVWLPVTTKQQFPFELIETYTYDEHNRPSEILSVYGDGREETTAFTYDEQGNLLAKVTCNQNGAEIAYVKQTYKDGKLQSKTELENGSSHEKTTTYTYDGEGRLQKAETVTGITVTEAYTYTEDGYTVTTYRDNKVFSVAEYDRDGNLYTITDGDGLLQEQNTYDGEGRLEKTLQYAAGESYYEYRYHYDEEGRLLRCDRYSYGELEYSLAYEYDQHGNQIRTLRIQGENKLTLKETEYALFGDPSK